VKPSYNNLCHLDFFTTVSGKFPVTAAVEWLKIAAP